MPSYQHTTEMTHKELLWSGKLVC